LKRNGRIAVVVVLASLAIDAFRVVHALITHTTRLAIRRHVQRLIEMTTCRVVIALALFALVHHVVSACIPRSIVVQGQATLTTIPSRVMLTLALAVYHQVHTFPIVLHTVVSCAARRMSIAKATAEHFELIDCVKVICGRLFVQADVITNWQEK